MRISSPAFAEGASIPSRHTCDGPDASPQLEWIDPPRGTQSFALIVDDPDAPRGTFTHWIVWNIPAQSRGLPESFPARAAAGDRIRQGSSDFGRPGWGGPCPPSGTHRYYFRLHALDAALDLPEGSRRADLEAAMEGHVLGRAETMGRYTRTR